MTIFLNPYYILIGVAVTLMVIGVLVYVAFVRLYGIVRTRPHKSNTISLSHSNPIGVEYSDKINIKEPIQSPTNEWDW